jgi:light-regulated signal transduction histidine kinase (bacteriophytochrome)
MKIEEDRLNIKTLHNIKADKMLIKLVFANLIDNAIKFSAHEKTPKIEIGSEEKGSEVEFYIKDNGIGFEMSFAAKLFGLFEKLHPETKFSGTGVGLAIVLKIISNHKGKVWTNSEPNKGATFYFTIPK